MKKQKSLTSFSKTVDIPPSALSPKSLKNLKSRFSSKMAPKQNTQKQDFIQNLNSSVVSVPSVKEIKSLSSYLSNYPIVMLGEASHGTSDFYRMRQHISRELVSTKNPAICFRFIAVEGDWPSCYAIHRYVTKGIGESAEKILKKMFKRWPTWMWANREMVEFLEWLKEYNMRLEPSNRIGFFGLDVYSLYESIESVIEELDKINSEMANDARKHYACFDRVGGGDEKKYTRSLMFRPDGCRDSVIAVLRKVLKRNIPYHDGEEDDDPDNPDSHIFNARQNAIVVRNAENYYRTMVLGDGDSWNVRDFHMADTLQRLIQAYSNCAKKRDDADSVKQVGGIVWAHNTHVGDHRFSDMARRGEITIGGVMRDRMGEGKVALLGFGTYRGTVIAARDQWGDPPKVLEVPPGYDGSFDEIFHQVSLNRKMPVWYTIFRKDDVSKNLLDRMQEEESLKLVDFRKEFGQFQAGLRAMGVVYDPRIEFLGNYVPSTFVNRFDAFVFVHTSKALEPLDTGVNTKEVPETYPTGV